MSKTQQKIDAINRSEVARETGLHVSYVSRVLAGKRNPPLTVAAKVAKAVGVSLDELNGYLEGVTAA